MSSHPGATSRTLTRLAAGVALAIIFLPTLGFLAVRHEGLARSLAVDARVQAAMITAIVGRNPGIWKDAHERLLEGIEPVRDAHRTTLIIENSGAVVTQAKTKLGWPTISRKEAFFDSGIDAGYVIVIASMSDILEQGLFVFVISAALGFVIFVPLRNMPARALQRASESLVRGELSRSLVDGLSAGVVLTDDHFRVIAFNSSASHMAGLARPIALRGCLLDCLDGAVGEDGKPFDTAQWPMRLCLHSESPTAAVTIGLRDTSDQPVWLSVRSAPTRHGEMGENLAVVTSFEDITTQKLNADRLHITERAVQGSRDAIMITDDKSKIVSVNAAFCHITGYSSDEVIGQRPSILQSGRHLPDFYAVMRESIKSKGSWSGEIWNRRRDGETFLAWLSISEVRDQSGRATHYIGTSFDLSERIKTELDIRHLARHDSLTGLPNRTHLREALGQTLAAATRHAWRVGIYFIDLDHFKLINDTYGHHAGDSVLLEVARRLKSVLRSEDTVARLGGDEFVVLTPNVGPDSEFVTVAENILHALSQPFVYDQDQLFVTTSIGIVAFPNDGTDIDALLSNADTAMYAAKADGRANFKFYTNQMNEAGHHQLEIIRAVKLALDRHEFVLFYQPQVDSRESHHIIGAEALIRWNRPGGDLVLPAQFIPAIDGTRLIIEVGKWVIDEAMRQGGQWRKQGMAVCISVNVSPLQFHQHDFVLGLRSAATRHGYIPGSIQLEVTESLMLTDPEETIRKMIEIHELGFLLSLDDFGTGYSSLSYLTRFPFDELKIDRSFISRLTLDRAAEAVVKTIITLSHSLDLQTVAEGVETDAEAALLRHLGCNKIQGYLYGRPMPAGEFENRARAMASGPPESVRAIAKS